MSQSVGSFSPGSAVAPVAQVELSVACRDLKDRDAVSKSDPVVVLYCSTFEETSTLYEHDRTEQVKNCLNPEFTKKFNLDYRFEENQQLKFEVYDVDSNSSKLEHHDFLGRCEITLGEIMGAAGSQVHRQLTGLHGKCGSIIITGDEITGNSKEVCYFQFKGAKLDKKDFLGKSDPFLEFHKLNDDGSSTLAYRSVFIKNTLNPVWKPFKIPLRLFCNGAHDRQFLISCYDHDNDGSSHDLIGTVKVTLNELFGVQKSQVGLNLINPKKQTKKHYKNSGELFVVQCTIKEEHTFLDYIRGGTQLHFTVAIDFTASNGNPTQPSSLHYIHPSLPNQYMMALRAVGNVCANYNDDKLFAGLGFGAKIPPNGSVSHEFFLNGNPADPRCVGVDGLLQAYRNSLMSVQLYGPTNFSPVINHVANFAARDQSGSHYFVLLIVTDGVITDINHTIKAIVDCSTLPMSIIIVGVGNAEFDAMNVLDADDKRLCANGRYAERDIVQFVPFREYLNTNNHNWSQARLAKDVLAEVPNQLTSWMIARGHSAKPPRPGRAADSAPDITPGGPDLASGMAGMSINSGQSGDGGHASQQTNNLSKSTYPSLPSAYPPQQGGYPPQQSGYPPQQSGYPPQQSGYPPQQGGYPPQQGGYPPQQGGYPPQQGGYPPQQGGYPPQQGGYPPQQGGYPPQQGGYPLQRGGYPPQQGGYPPQQGGYPPQKGGNPPQQGGYPPQQDGYPPQQSGYPPQQSGYPPQQSGYPPQQGGYPPQSMQQQNSYSSQLSGQSSKHQPSPFLPPGQLPYPGNPSTNGPGNASAPPP